MTVSKRSGWFDRACAQVAKQSLLPEKWIIVPEETFEIEADMPCPVEFWPAPMQVRVSNLNASENEGLKHVTTPYVILYNDFIDLPKNCFKKLMDLVDEETFVCVSPYNADGSSDSRHTGVNKPRPIHPEEWEPMVGAAPMSVYRELGGYDEEYDNGWAWDNVNIAERAAMLGRKFILDESNRPHLLPHEQTTKLVMETNGERHLQTLAEIRSGIRPLKCNYL